MKPIERSVAEFPDIKGIISSLTTVSFKLEQDTEDIAQLNPIERLNSISKVWDTCKDKIGKPSSALDVGSGFGYGTIFLEAQGIKTIGIENVGRKIKQGQDLFKLIGINVPNTGKLDFAQHPAFFEGDITVLQTGVQVDLITLFYLSLQMVSTPETFQALHSLLKKDGTILLSTQAGIQEVQAFLDHSPIPLSFSCEIVEVLDNFEKTAILLKFK